MHQACRIRACRSSDLSQIQAIALRAFAPVFASIRDHVGEPMATLAYGSAEADQSRHLARLCRSDAIRDMLVVERQRRVIGFGHVALDPGTKIGEIGINAIDPPFQGKGYGRKLHDAMLNRMRRAGMQAATVATGADDAHASAREAYGRAGFNRQIPSVYFYRAL